MKKLTFLLLFFLPTSAVLADARIKNVNFSATTVLPIAASPLNTTMIQFGADETIANISLGDSTSWMVNQLQNSQNQLILKPTSASTDTDLIVNTNKYTYFFHLMVNSGNTPLYAVIFHYPEADLQKLNNQLQKQKQQNSAQLSIALNPTAYNWNYSYSGDASITPLHVFDDGTRTYFQFPSNAVLPSVFGVDNPQGKEAVVNVRFKDNYLIVDRIEPQFTLRLGKHVTSIFNEKLINHG